jgi:hypothetical protein
MFFSLESKSVEKKVASPFVDYVQKILNEGFFIQ